MDGDTLQLDRKIEGTDRVRLIGVDTSELHGQNGKSEPYAEAAKTFTSDQLKGKDVLLAPGKDKTDDYGRLLAYVWTTPGDGLMGAVKGMLGGGPALFNRTLVDKGYARVMPVPPNDRYAACFEAAQKAARSSGEGRWTTDATTFDEPMGGSTADGATLSTLPRPGETTGGATLPATTETTLATTTATTAPAKTTGPTASSSTSASPITSATTSGKPEVTTQETTVQPATTTPGTTAGSTSTDQASTPLPPSVDTTPAQPTLPDTWPPPSASPRATAVTPTATPTVSPETSSAPSTIPYESLPQSTTPSGYTHYVLPDTGGRSPLYLLIGAALVGAGLLVWRGRPQDGPGS